LPASRAHSLAAAVLAVVGVGLVALGLWPTGRGSGEEAIYLTAAGLVHLLAAFGTFRQRNWGRLLGIVVSVVGLLAVIGLGLFIVLLALATRAEIPGVVLAALVPLAVYGFVLYALRRRFPDDGAPASAARPPSP
jgi:peptidoglycan/LPS O-acetylase OafA/YrhL